MWTAICKNKKSFRGQISECLPSGFTSVMMSSRLTARLHRLHSLTACFLLLVVLIGLLESCRDHYVEGRMRGAAPNKKIPTAPQKNDV